MSLLIISAGVRVILMEFTCNVSFLALQVYNPLLIRGTHC